MAAVVLTASRNIWSSSLWKGNTEIIALPGWFLMGVIVTIKPKLWANKIPFGVVQQEWPESLVTYNY